MSRVMLLILFVALLVVVYLSCFAPVTVPVYRLATPRIDAAMVLAFAEGRNPVLVDTTGRFILRDGPTRTVVYKASGGIWSEDTTEHWNPAKHPFLLPDSALLAPALQLVRKGQPLKTSAADSGIVRYSFAGSGGSFVKRRRRDTGVTDAPRALDRQLNFGATVPAGGGLVRPRPPAPMIGGGGRFKVTYGDNGKRIAFSGVWREISGVDTMVRLIPVRRARQQFDRLTNHTATRVSRPTLAYYSAPLTDAQWRLYPVYVFDYTIMVDNTAVRLTLTVQASGYPNMALMATAPCSQLARISTTDPTTGWDDPEPAGQTTDAHPEVGAVWMEKVASPQLKETCANVTGLLSALGGWTINFRWGDENAWIGDWYGYRDKWTDGVDLAYYAGHASSVGWQLWSPPTTASPHGASRSVATASLEEKHWGNNDLEWIAVNGCGPLQDKAIGKNGHGEAMDRWDKAFGGLHILLGFATSIVDNPNQGKLFAETALTGQTLIDSWFSAATIVQANSNYYAAAMYAYYDATPEDERAPMDHLWGSGFVSKDPVDPDYYELIWTQL